MVNIEGGYFSSSGRIFLLARNAHQRTKEASEGATVTDGQQGAIVAVICSALTLEAIIPELVHAAAAYSRSWADRPYLKLFEQVMEQAKSLSTQERYLMAKAILPGEPFEKGALPFADLDLLFRARNAIVHLKPQKASKKPINFIAGLHSRGVIPGDILPPESKVSRSWLDYLCSPLVSKWACNTVVSVVAALRQSLQDERENDPIKMVRATLNRFQPID